MIIVIHLVRLAIDLILLGLLLSREVYEFPTPLVALVICRMIVGHFGRIAQGMGFLTEKTGKIIAQLASIFMTIKALCADGY